MTGLLLRHTGALCRNDLSGRIYFIIKPNHLEESAHLDEGEKENLKNSIQELNRLWTLEEAADRLVIEDKVPVWINMSVNKASKRQTIVELLTSRRFRKEDYLFKDGLPPFHISIPLPPYYKKGEKFDVNWQHRRWKFAWNAWWWNRKNGSR